MGRIKQKKKKAKGKKPGKGINRRKFAHITAIVGIGSILGAGIVAGLQQWYTAIKEDKKYESIRQKQWNFIEEARRELAYDAGHFIDNDKRNDPEMILKRIQKDLSIFYPGIIKHYNEKFGKNSPYPKILADNATIDAFASVNRTDLNASGNIFKDIKKDYYGLKSLKEDDISDYLTKTYLLTSSGKEFLEVTKNHQNAWSLEKIALSNNMQTNYISQMYARFYDEMQKYLSSEEQIRDAAVSLVAASALNNGDYESIQKIITRLMEAKIISKKQLERFPYAVISGISVCQDTKERRLHHLPELEFILLNPKKFISTKPIPFESSSGMIHEPYMEASLIYSSGFRDNVKQTLYAAVPRKYLMK